MKKLLTASLLLATLAAHAQATEADVRKIDKAQGKITLKHEGIKSLDMPPMTISMHVQNPALLDAVAVGDKVRVDVQKIDGQYTVTRMVKAP